jgi:hypothetical protein
MPEEALVGAWTKSAHKLWVKRLRRTSSLSDLLQVFFFFSSDNIFYLLFTINRKSSFSVEILQFFL